MNAVINAENVYSHYGNFNVLEDINFSITQGQIVGLIGPNGAGKTTLLKAILGLTHYAGDLSVLGYTPYRDQAKMLQRLCFIADVAILPRWMEVNQAIDFVAAVHPRFNREKALQFIANTDIQRNGKINHLSKGMIVQLHLSLIMAIDADILILDEPTLGLDILSRKEFYRSLLNDYYNEERTIIITTHQVEEVEHILTDMILLDHGKIKLQCSLENMEQRFLAVDVSADQADKLRTLNPLYEEPRLGQIRFLFDNVPAEQLQTFANPVKPSISDIFVAVVKGQNA